MQIVPDEDLRFGRELERKYLEVLMNRLAEHERGEITLETLQACFYSVRDTITGLVNWGDLNEIMSEFEAYFKENE